MASIAKRLVGAASARTPEIRLTRFDGDGIRAFLSNLRFRHDESSSFIEMKFLSRTIPDGARPHPYLQSQPRAIA
jgi:hypothetical protein